MFALVLVNQANGVSTGCACQTIMYQGHWADDSSYLHTCVDRSITVDDEEFTVKTSALISWDTWRQPISQTWACDAQ
ncbi:Uu.00g132370.m01.CDS01 [Anthostomella pinea]|uniref:Uu.00g132370.m01.CDS01 n=1 Tax=Anthostomella pinea TaxID=933095 RepID=A0AAI8VIZ8_9PEZI|nr:Uu.00g132370.m01.CDS01 [Anthostomella pinea]